MEWLYVLCFVSTRLLYVAFLWHEVYFNYPDKSVAFLYTITISLHVYWFVLYIKTQKRFRAKQRRQQLEQVLTSLANSAKAEYVASIVDGTKSGAMKESRAGPKRRKMSGGLESDGVSFEERCHQRSSIGRDSFPFGGAQAI